MSKAKKKGLFAFLLALLASAIVSGTLLLSPATVNAATGAETAEDGTVTISGVSNGNELFSAIREEGTAGQPLVIRFAENTNMEFTAGDNGNLYYQDESGQMQHLGAGNFVIYDELTTASSITLDLNGGSITLDTQSIKSLDVLGVDLTIMNGAIKGTASENLATSDSDITLENVDITFNYEPAATPSGGAAVVTTANLTLADVNFTLNGTGATEYTAEGTVTNAVAKVGDTYYTDVKTAIESATDGQTATLIDNAAISEVVFVYAANVTLNLGEYTLTIPENFQDKLYDDQGEEKGAGVAIRVYGSLTLAGGENGRIDATKAPETTNPLAAQPGGVITVNSGTIEVDTNSEACIFAFTGGKVIINGGSLINRATGDYTWGGEEVLVVNAASNATTPANTMVQVNGGTFIGRNPAFGDDAIGGTFITEEVKTVTYTLDGQTYIMVYDAETEPSLPEGADPIGGDYFEGETLVNEVNSAAALSSVLDNVAEEAYIRLGASFKADVVIPEGKTVTLDLNGKTITNVTNHTITNYGTLTVKGEGVVDNVTHQKCALFNLGTATLLGGEYTRSLENSSTNSWYAIKNLGHLTIGAEGEECSVQVIQDGNFSSLITNGYYDADGKAGGDYDTYSGLVTTDDKLPTLTINGGTFRGGINTVKNDNHSVATINGGEFVNTTQATVLNWNELTINGGTFNADSNALYAVITSYDGSTDYNNGITNIAGGKFTGAIIADYGAANVHYAISGGEFANAIPESYIAENSLFYPEGEGYKVEEYSAALLESVLSRNESYVSMGNKVFETAAAAAEEGAVAVTGQTAYADLQEAINEAKDGDTVKLLDDTKATMQSTTVKSEITIDLNGKTITTANDMSFILNLKAEKDITIKNGSLSGKAINVVAAADDVHINISGITVKRLNDKDPEESDNQYKGVTPPVLVIGAASAEYITNATLEEVHINVYVDAQGYSGQKAVEIYNANVTIKDSSVFADSKEGITINGVAIKNSDVTVTGSEIVSTTGSAMGFLGALSFEAAFAGDAENFNTLTVENSMLTGYTIALSGSGGEGNSGTVINVIDSQLNSTGKIGPAIYHPQYGIINISGDKTVLKGSSGIEIRAGIANISGGEFTANAETFSAVASGNGTTTDGAAVAVVQHTTKLPVQVNITGGTFNTETESGKTLYQADLQNNGEEAVAKIAMDVSGGQFNGAVESKNVKGFITGGRFAELPAEDAFAEGLAGELYDGYYMVVNAEDVNAAASIADRLSAQSDLRAYLASFGLTITDMQLVAESDELAADIVAAYDEIFAASTKDGVAEALAAAMDAVDAYKLGLDIEKAAALTELTEYAMGAQGEDLAIVVVPTYAISAINAAVTADEIETYVSLAKAEMDDIRAQRAEAEQQYQAVNDRFDAIMQALGITGSAEEGYTSEVLDKLNGVIEALGITEADGAWSTDLLDGITEDLETANENIAAMQDLLGTAADEATAQTIIGMIKATQNSVASAETNIKNAISTLSADINSKYDTLIAAVNGLPAADTFEQLSGTVSELAGKVDAMNTAVSGFETTVTDRLNGIDEAIGGLTEAQNALTEAVNGYKAAVDSTLADFNAKFAELSAKVNELPTSDELKQSLTDALSLVHSKLDAIKTETDKIDGLHDSITNTVSGDIAAAFNEFEETFTGAMNGINTKLDSLDSAIAALPDDADITALKESVQAATDAAKEAGTKVDTLGTTLSGRFDSVDSAITSIDDAIDVLTAAQNAMNEAMTAFRAELNTTLSGVNEAIAAVKADVKALADTAAADKVELLEKLNALQTSADAIEQAIASLDGDSSADLSAISAELAALQTSLGDVADVVDEVALGNTNSSSSFAGIYVYLSAILVLAAVILIVLAVKKRR